MSPFPGEFPWALAGVRVGLPHPAKRGAAHYAFQITPGLCTSAGVRVTSVSSSCPEISALEPFLPLTRQCCQLSLASGRPHCFAVPYWLLARHCRKQESAGIRWVFARVLLLWNCPAHGSGGWFCWGKVGTGWRREPHWELAMSC